MDDLISRQAAIDLWDKYHLYIASKAMAYDGELRALPSAQPEKRTEERTETHACDSISRQDAAEMPKRTEKSTQNVPNDDLVSRKAAIDTIVDMDVDSRVSWKDAVIDAIDMLPSAQPELIAQDAYVRGFEQGRTQGMIDVQGEPMSRPIDNTIKAEWTNADALDLQPTCNQLATDAISRQAAIDAICKACANSDDYVECVERRPESTFCDEIVALRKLPSAQLDLSEHSDKLWRAAYERGIQKAQLDIVYCRECKYSAPNGKYGCRLRRFSSLDENAGMHTNDYCSKGVRREG